MRKFYSILFCLLLSIPSIRADYKIIDSKWEPYFKSYNASDITAIPKLLVGEEIYFKKNTNSNSEVQLNQFLNITPDTIWIKRHKKPKFNKHYKLMPYYHGVENGESSNIIQYTPYHEIADYVFRVDSVSCIMIDNSNENSITKYCHVYLYNTKTSEHLIWVYKSSNNNPLTLYSKSLGAKIITDCPEFYWKNKKKQYTPTKHTSTYTNREKNIPDSKISSNKYVKTSISSATYFIKLNSSKHKPKLNLSLSNKIEVLHTDLSYNIISINQYQEILENERKIQEAELEEKKVYNIDNSYFIDSTLFTDYPFKFRVIYGTTKSGYAHKSLSKHTNDYNGEYLSSGHKISIADKKKIHGNYYYIGLLKNKCFYILEKNVSIPIEEQFKLDTLLSCDTITRNRFLNFSKYNHSMTERQYAIERLSELSNHTKYGLSIINWGVYDESEYTDGTGLEFEFFNPTKKTIKYITINFVGYNAVDDPVSTYEGRTLTRKCIGPIEPGNQATYEFEYVWFTDIVEYAKIKSILVQYKDGTSKRINNASNIIWSDELNSFFNDSILDGIESIELITTNDKK